MDGRAIRIEKVIPGQKPGPKGPNKATGTSARPATFKATANSNNTNSSNNNNNSDNTPLVGWQHKEANKRLRDKKKADAANPNPLRPDIKKESLHVQNIFENLWNYYD